MSEAFKEALKELGRVVVLAVLPVVIVALESNAIDWKVVGLTALLAVLKALDKYVHERKDIAAKGVVPF